MLAYDPLKRHRIEDIEMIVRSAVNCSRSTDIKKKHTWLDFTYIYFSCSGSLINNKRISDNMIWIILLHLFINKSSILFRIFPGTSGSYHTSLSYHPSPHSWTCCSSQILGLIRGPSKATSPQASPSPSPGTAESPPPSPCTRSSPPLSPLASQLRWSSQYRSGPLFILSFQ